MLGRWQVLPGILKENSEPHVDNMLMRKRMMVMVKENSEPHVENMLMRKRMMVMVMVLVILMENSEPDVDEEGDDGDGDAVHGDDGYGEVEQRAPTTLAW